VTAARVAQLDRAPDYES